MNAILDVAFGPKNDLLWWQECDRAVLIFVYGFALVRLSGRRIFGKWAALDIIVSIMVGSNLSRALTGSADLWGTLAATTLLVVLHAVLSHLGAAFPSFGRLLEGRVVPLARAGERDDSAFLRHAITEADLDEALRQSGVESVAATRLVGLEPSGKITVLKP